MIIEKLSFGQRMSDIFILSKLSVYIQNDIMCYNIPTHISTIPSLLMKFKVCMNIRRFIQVSFAFGLCAARALRR